MGSNTILDAARIAVQYSTAALTHPVFARVREVASGPSVSRADGMPAYSSRNADTGNRARVGGLWRYGARIAQAGIPVLRSAVTSLLEKVGSPQKAPLQGAVTLVSSLDGFGKATAQKILTTSQDEVRLVTENPFYLGAALLYKLGVPESHSLRLAEQIENNWQGNASRDAAMKKFARRDDLLDGASPFFRPETLPDLLEIIFRELYQGDGLDSARAVTLARARKFVEAVLFQYHIVKSTAPKLSEGKRIGPELEYMPPRHLTEKLSALESASGKEELRPLNFEEIAKAWLADLNQSELIKKGWSFALTPSAPIPLGANIKIFPSESLNFSYAGHEFAVLNFQGTGGNFLEIRVDNELLGLTNIPMANGPVDDDTQEVVERLAENKKIAIDRIVAHLKLEGSSDSTEKIRAAILEKLESPAATRYVLCPFKDETGKIHLWGYDRVRRQVYLVDTKPIGSSSGESKFHFENIFEDFPAAYSFLRNQLSGAKVDLEAASVFNGVTASNADQNITRSLGYEAFGAYEDDVAFMRLTADQVAFYSITNRTLERLGAEGFTGQVPVAQQLHVEAHQSGSGLAASLEGVAGVVQNFFRWLPFMKAGMALHPARETFIKLPEKGEGSPLERQVRAAREIVGNDLERSTSPAESDTVWLERFVRRINELFAVHFGMLNLDNVNSVLLEEWLAAETNEMVKPAIKELIRTYKKMPTVEIRSDNTPFKLDESGKAVLDSQGIEWNLIFWATLLQVFQNGQEENDELIPARFRHLQAEALAAYLPE